MTEPQRSDQLQNPLPLQMMPPVMMLLTAEPLMAHLRDELQLATGESTGHSFQHHAFMYTCVGYGCQEPFFTRGGTSKITSQYIPPSSCPLLHSFPPGRLLSCDPYALTLEDLMQLRITSEEELSLTVEQRNHLNLTCLKLEQEVAAIKYRIAVLNERLANMRAAGTA